jgi:hypothetical protein
MLTGLKRLFGGARHSHDLLIEGFQGRTFNVVGKQSMTAASFHLILIGLLLMTFESVWAFGLYLVWHITWG